MSEVWSLAGNTAPIEEDTVIGTLRARVSNGELETWLTSSSGRTLAFVTNKARAMVMLWRNESDPGEHAITPQAGDGLSEGFVLANGQRDEYYDTETVPLEEGLRIVKHIVGSGSWPADSQWMADR
ncbi:hypothetical protein [Dyella japonica]|uniref:Uncharacterized protein n=1 Tax=Dyella japonica TaxID=231455 RepID=A0ABV2JNG7_9GAMM